MTPLAKLNPSWIGVLRPGPVSGEGIKFDCPVCGPKHTLAAYFENPLDGSDPAAWQNPKWKRVGESLETLTVQPSINYPCFHGWIERGMVFDVKEAPLTVLLVIGVKPQVVSLSPEQTIECATQALSAAKRMLGE